MTCKRTLHSRFASGRFTSVLLFAFSLLLMLSAFWYPASAVPVQLPSEPSFMGGLASRLLSTIFYAVSAILISGQDFFDRRVRWVGAFYMWMVAVLPFVNGNSTLALSSFLSVLAFVILFAIILVGIIFDMIGVAIASVKEAPFHSMASKKNLKKSRRLSHLMLRSTSSWMVQQISLTPSTH